MSGPNKYYVQPEDVAKALQDMGYRGKVGVGDHPAFVESAALGFNFRTFLFEKNVEDVGGYASYQFEIGIYITRSSNIPLLFEIFNYFNNEFRFAKFGLAGNQRKYAYLQIDFGFSENWRPDFEDRANYFFYVLDVFLRHVVKSEPFEGNNLPEKHSMAISYIWGEEKNIQEAVRLYREAAHGGFAGSQNNLGDQYEIGDNVEKSEIYAAYWYARSAERGEPTAYLSLATLFAATGADTEMLVDAAKFAILAIAELPDGTNKETAERCLQSLAERLEEEDFARAEHLARMWRPLFQERNLMSDTPDKRSDTNSPSRSLH
jgi:hypothetical protein